MPGSLRQASEKIYQGQLERMKEQMELQAEEIRQALRDQYARIVRRMADVLTTEPGERKKAIRGTLLPSVREFLDLFDMRNVTDDRELAGLVARTKALVEGVDAEDLKSDRNRAQLAQDFARIEADIKTAWVVDRPRRAARLIEDEPAE